MPKSDCQSELSALQSTNELNGSWIRWYSQQLRQNSVCAPAQPGHLYACPCCGHNILKQRGAFEICDQCYWQDDGQDDADADVVRGGPNGHLSLSMARANFRRYGACEERFLAVLRKTLSA